MRNSLLISVVGDSIELGGNYGILKQRARNLTAPYHNLHGNEFSCISFQIGRKSN